MFRSRIGPKWGNFQLQDIRALDVEKWLGSLSLAAKTKANIRNLMHLVFEFARRWELTDKNPIELVRQSSRRAKTPRRLTIEEFRALLAELSEPYKTIAILAGCLGLRISEISGLQWGDVDLLNSTLSIRRSVVQGHIGPAKTMYSEASLPLSQELVKALTNWYSRAAYRSDGDFVFAGDSGKPLWADVTRERELAPAASRANLGKIGWHTLRHTYATVLEQVGARMKVAQELLRHADIQTTMNVYTGVMEKDKREAADRVAQALLGTVQ
jgi:integrase